MKTMTNNPDDDNPICEKCGLWKSCRHPFMRPDGPQEAELIVVGEAPGFEEDREGKPFVGRSGGLLRPVIDELGWGNSVLYTNVVRCRPPDNKITKKAIDCCSTFVMQEIDMCNPKRVLLFGNSPLYGVLGESGITSWNGTIINRDDRIYVPIYHPAYIQRNMSMLDEWLDTISAALSDKGNRQSKFKKIYPKTMEDIMAMKDVLNASEYIAFDTEVHRLDAFHVDNVLLSVSFAVDGYSYAIPVNHKDSWWDTSVDFTSFKGRKVSDREEVVSIIIEILSRHSGYVLGHNLKFDQLQMYALTGLWFEGGGDTMILSHLLDSRQGIHGLKHLAGKRLGMYEYEGELMEYRRSHKEADPERGGSYNEMPLDVLLPYGAMDAEAVWLLHPMLYEELSPKQTILYDQLLVNVSDVLGIMQSNGMVIDTYIADRYWRVYECLREELMEEIQSDPKVRRMAKGRPRGWKFNPASFKQKGELYFEFYGMNVTAKTLSGNASTSAKVMMHQEADWPILKTIRMHNMLGKMVNTYLKPAATGVWLSGDGKARTTYNIHGTISGRLSSSKPFNSQNMPTPEKEPGTVLEFLPVKNIITASPGNVVMVADFSGMELRVFASAANCKKMLDIHKSGKDFHSMVAVLSTMHKSVGAITDKDIASIEKAVRYRYKWTNWTLLYGGDAYTLSNLYDIPMEDAEQTVYTYFETFPEVRDYQQACVEFAEEHGYIESPYGRRAWLPWINETADRGRRNKARREAVNIPIQSAASDTLLFSLVILQDVLLKHGKEAKLVNTVHDSIMLDCPVGEVREVANLTKDVMERVATYAEDYMPDVDFSWLKCPLKVDIEVGTHYGTLIDLEEWENDNL